MMEIMGVFGYYGVNGVIVVSYVMKGDNLGIEFVFCFLNVLMVKVMNRNFVIFMNV